MSLDFLLEIGTEEIPHWMIPSALAQLEKLDLLGATPRVDATPRRLVVRATGVPAATAAREEIVKGPPVASGEKAAQGFAKKHGVDASQIQVNGNYYELRKTFPGRAAREILAASPALRDPRHPVAQDHVLDRRQERPSLHPPHPLDRRASRRPGYPV